MESIILMMEMITGIVIPQRIEEWIAILFLLALWIYHFGLREETKIKIDYNKSISETVSMIIIWSLIMTAITFFSLKVIFRLAGGIFT